MSWLTKIVSTTLVVVTGCILAIALTAFFMLATMFGKVLDPITFGSMLAFAAAFAGVGYKQFKTKRETEWAEDDAGNAYRPTSSRPVPRDRYDTGVRFGPPRGDQFRDVSSGSGTTLAQIPVPESVEDRENAGQEVLPPPPAREPEPEPDEWEGEEGG